MAEFCCRCLPYKSNYRVWDFKKTFSIGLTLNPQEVKDKRALSFSGIRIKVLTHLDIIYRIQLLVLVPSVHSKSVIIRNIHFGNCICNSRTPEFSSRYIYIHTNKKTGQSVRPCKFRCRLLEKIMQYVMSFPRICHNVNCEKLKWKSLFSKGYEKFGPFLKNLYIQWVFMALFHFCHTYPPLMCISMM